MTTTTQTTTVSDEAIEAAAKHSYEYEGDRKGILYVGWEYEGEQKREYWRDSVRQVLTAALPHLTISAAPCSVEVKKLEWQDIDGQSLAVPFDRALNYGILNITNGMGEYTWSLTVAGVFGSQYKTLEQAKAAAQADFDRRILSQIVTKPVDVAAVLEQCAIIAEGFRDKHWIAHDIKTGIFPNRSEAGIAIAAAIRALSPAERVTNETFGFSNDPSTKDQIAAVFLASGTPKQKAEAISYAHGVVSAAKPVDQWQDIATCEPVHALFYGTDRHGEKCVMQGYKAINGTIYIDNRDAAPVKITHWMPLPAAPVSKGGE